MSFSYSPTGYCLKHSSPIPLSGPVNPPAPPPPHFYQPPPSLIPALGINWPLSHGQRTIHVTANITTPHPHPTCTCNVGKNPFIYIYTILWLIQYLFSHIMTSQRSWWLPNRTRRRNEIGRSPLVSVSQGMNGESKKWAWAIVGHGLRTL